MYKIMYFWLSHIAHIHYFILLKFIWRLDTLFDFHRMRLCWVHAKLKTELLALEYKQPKPRLVLFPFRKIQILNHTWATFQASHPFLVHRNVCVCVSFVLSLFIFWWFSIFFWLAAISSIYGIFFISCDFSKKKTQWCVVYMHSNVLCHWTQFQRSGQCSAFRLLAQQLHTSEFVFIVCLCLVSRYLFIKIEIVLCSLSMKRNWSMLSV